MTTDRFGQYVKETLPASMAIFPLGFTNHGEIRGTADRTSTPDAYDYPIVLPIAWHMNAHALWVTRRKAMWRIDLGDVLIQVLLHFTNAPSRRLIFTVEFPDFDLDDVRLVLAPVELNAGVRTLRFPIVARKIEIKYNMLQFGHCY